MTDTTAHPSLDLEPHRVANFRKLSAGLRKLANDDARFGMRQFHETGKAQKTHPCGSVACAVGWAPYFGVPYRQEEDWWEFSDRELVDSETPEWEWCFCRHLEIR